MTVSELIMLLSTLPNPAAQVKMVDDLPVTGILYSDGDTIYITDAKIESPND